MHQSDESDVPVLKVVGNLIAVLPIILGFVAYNQGNIKIAIAAIIIFAVCLILGGGVAIFYDIIAVIIGFVAASRMEIPVVISIAFFLAILNIIVAICCFAILVKIHRMKS